MTRPLGDGVLSRVRVETVRRYGLLAYGSLGIMSGVGLMVLGSLLVGLAIAVLLGGLGIADAGVEGLSTGAMLISSIVLSVVGLFFLGLASEGPLGRGRRLVGYDVWELGIGRVAAVFVVGLSGVVLYGVVMDNLTGLPAPIRQGAEGFRAVGVAGLTVMPLLGVPLSIAVRFAPELHSWLRDLEVPLLFVVWAVSAMILLT